MARGNLSCVALLRPLEALMMSSSTLGSSPALTPIAIASEVATSAVAARRLLASFALWASPGFSPVKKILPKVRSTGSISPKTGLGQDTMTASVPALAPVTPPLTGASTQPMRRSASWPATSVATPGPVVERSIIRRTFEPLMMPAFPPSATVRTMSGVGRLTSTISACEATSAGEAASVAPRAANGAVASAETS
jgi:hypothetical protein